MSEEVVDAAAPLSAAQVPALRKKSKPPLSVSVRFFLWLVVSPRMTPCLKRVALGSPSANNPKWQCLLYLLILTVLEALTSIWVSLSGYVPFLLSKMLCVSRRCIV